MSATGKGYVSRNTPLENFTSGRLAYLTHHEVKEMDDKEKLHELHTAYKKSETQETGELIDELYTIESYLEEEMEAPTETREGFGDWLHETVEELE